MTYWKNAAPTDIRARAFVVQEQKCRLQRHVFIIGRNPVSAAAGDPALCFSAAAIWNAYIEALKGTVDVYLPDIKYYNDLYSVKYSSTGSYFEYSSKAVMAIYSQVGYPEFDKDGIIKKGLISRHLVLPGLGSDSRRIFRWIRENIGKYAYMSIMCQILS